MVERKPSKLHTRVRFPSPAPFIQPKTGPGRCRPRAAVRSPTCPVARDVVNAGRGCRIRLAAEMREDSRIGRLKSSHRLDTTPTASASLDPHKCWAASGAHLSLLQCQNRTVGREARSSHEPGIGARTFLSARICRTNSRTRMSALLSSRTAPSSGGAVASDFPGRSSSAAADVTGGRTNSRTRMSALRFGAQGAKEAFSEFFPHSMGRGGNKRARNRDAPLHPLCER